VSKMRKRVIRGWIGKNDTAEDAAHFGVRIGKRGRKDMWDEDAWPPRKVKVVIEEV